MNLPDVGTSARICFLDETGVVAQDNFFAVGVLTIGESSDLPTFVRKFRQRSAWVGEWHFSRMNERELSHYKALIDLLREHCGWSFCLTLADRSNFDVSAACGDRYVAYERIAAQSIAASMSPDAQAVVLADEYSTPDSVRFEEDVRWCVNSQLGGNVVAGAVRVSSDSHDLMQVADVLTGAIVYPFRSSRSRQQRRPTAKRRLANYVAKELGNRLPVSDFDQAWLIPPNREQRNGPLPGSHP